jgi:GGDEF domain-containing protein
MGQESLLLRLLLLHEVTAGFSEASFAEVLARAERGVEWVFPGARLLALLPEEAQGLPGRGLGRFRGLLGYGAYFPGPPLPLYLFLEHPGVERPEELRLAALFMEHLLAGLRGAGYREELERQARTDWLTGLGNRRALERALREGLAQGEVLMVMDLDGLKALNDREGHLAGDALLRRFGACLQALARSHGGRGFRLGGDEFALILPERALGEARRALEAFPVSLGVARAEEGQGQALLELADQRMYWAKRRKKRQTPSSAT